MASTHETVFLLGAGASIDAGLPDSFDLTEMLVERLRHDDGGRGLPSAAAAFVFHILAAARTQQWVVGKVDVERFVASINLLATREQLPVAPFVESWHRGLAAFESMPESTQYTAGRLLERVSGLTTAGPRRSDDADQLGAGLIDVINRVGNPRMRRTHFVEIERRIHQALFRLLDIPEVEAVAYLRDIVRHAAKTGAPIVTLNYDLAIETCARGLAMPYSTGVETWKEVDQLSFAKDAVHILKLHGSLDWQITRTSGVGLPTTSVNIFGGVTPTPGTDTPAIIFGEGNKLRAEGPFLELFMEFAQRLRGASSLVSIGYSFRDSHINEVISRWMSRDDSHRLVVVDPAFGETQPQLAVGEQSLAIDLDRTYGKQPQLLVIREPAATGIPAAIAAVSPA